MTDHYKLVREKYKRKSQDYWDSMAKKYKFSAILIPGDLEIKNLYYNLLHERIMSKIFAEIPPHSKIVEIGCGVGRWSIKLAKAGMDVTAIDISKEMVKIAQKNAKKENANIDFKISSADKLELKQNFYDYALSVTVLQHIIDEKKRLKAIENLVNSLKPGGKLILLERVGKDSGEFHVKPWTLEMWGSVFSGHGCVLEKRVGVDLSPFINLINKLGSKIRYKNQPIKDFPGKVSVEESISPKTLSAYKASLKIATKLSKPIDYYMANLPLLKNKTSHNILIFRKR